ACSDDVFTFQYSFPPFAAASSSRIKYLSMPATICVARSPSIFSGLVPASSWALAAETTNRRIGMGLTKRDMATNSGREWVQSLYTQSDSIVTIGTIAISGTPTLCCGPLCKICPSCACLAGWARYNDSRHGASFDGWPVHPPRLGRNFGRGGSAAARSYGNDQGDAALGGEHETSGRRHHSPA